MRHLAQGCSSSVPVFAPLKLPEGSAFADRGYHCVLADLEFPEWGEASAWWHKFRFLDPRKSQTQARSYLLKCLSSPSLEVSEVTNGLVRPSGTAGAKPSACPIFYPVLTLVSPRSLWDGALPEAYAGGSSGDLAASLGCHRESAR